MQFHLKEISKIKASFLVSILVISTHSCHTKTDPLELATRWSNNAKTKIFADANREPDSTVYDSTHHILTLYLEHKKLKQFEFAQKKDQDEHQKPIYDTGRIIFFSKDQNFQYIKEPCIFAKERSYEEVLYERNGYGAVEYHYCNKPLILKGFHFKNLNVGTWTKYDAKGNVTEKQDFGNAEKLEGLEDFKIAGE